MTPIANGTKCSFCKEEQTEVHLYGLCKAWKGARIELHRKIRTMTTLAEWNNNPTKNEWNGIPITTSWSNNQLSNNQTNHNPSENGTN